MDITSRPEPDSLQFTEEIQNLLTLPLETTNSFTALLELPPNQAMELLYSSNSPTRPVLENNPDANLTVIKSEEAEEALVTEKAGQSQDRLKRKGMEINDVKASSKKSKSKSAAAKASEEERQKLPYVQVRARRGQATDSHSLAERARREKINARMKLLQELVPGCNKISGTALVLDEIINHVQALQRQVEILSMKLAAVNPRIDFNLDSILSAESGSLIHSNFPNMVMPVTWPDIQVNENNQSQYHQQWQLDVVHQPIWGRDNDAHNFVTPEDSLLSYDSSANSASLNLSRLKMEL